MRKIFSSIIFCLIFTSSLFAFPDCNKDFNDIVKLHEDGIAARIWNKVIEYKKLDKIWYIDADRWRKMEKIMSSKSKDIDLSSVFFKKEHVLNQKQNNIIALFYYYTKSVLRDIKKKHDIKNIHQVSYSGDTRVCQADYVSKYYSDSFKWIITSQSDGRYIIEVKSILSTVKINLGLK